MPKSEAMEAYRREIAAYLELVKLGTGWTLAQMGQHAGGLAHTTVSRALKGEHTMGFPALLALEHASRVSIPDSLTLAARQAQQPTRPQTMEEQIAALASDLMDRSPEEQRAFLAAVRKRLARTG